MIYKIQGSQGLCRGQVGHYAQFFWGIDKFCRVGAHKGKGSNIKVGSDPSAYYVTEKLLV